MSDGADCADGGEGSERADMAKCAHQAGGKPAADEEADEMSRAEQTDFSATEPFGQPRERIQRPKRPCRKLQKNH